MTAAPKPGRTAAPTGFSSKLPKTVPPHLRREALPLAKRYIWWEEPAKSLLNFPRFLGHSMNLATWKDQRWLEQNVPAAHLLRVLAVAPAGTFTARSWNYWHVRLGKLPPPLPEKRIPA